MAGRSRIQRIGTTAAMLAAAGTLWAAAVPVVAGNAVAEPLPVPAEPEVQPPPPAELQPPALPGPPPPATPLFPLAQQGAPVNPGGLPAVPDLSGRTANEFVLGQGAAPAPPGGASATTPSLSALNNQYLLPQHAAPSAPGEAAVFGVAPGQENADTGRIDYLKRLYDTYRAGGFRGGLLGQMPVGLAGQPLPDDASASIPGAAIPPVPQPPPHS